jgi:hypothetical protein
MNINSLKRMILLLAIGFVPGGCSDDRTSSSSQLTATNGATPSFGEAVVCRIIEDMQPGSNHYLSCLSLAKEAIAQGMTSRSQQIDYICSRVGDYVSAFEPAETEAICREKAEKS